MLRVAANSQPPQSTGSKRPEPSANSRQQMTQLTGVAGVAQVTQATQVAQAVPSLGLDLSEAQINALLAYLDLISKWTRVYNLTAVRDPAEMVTHHLLDCLAAMRPLASYLKQARDAETASAAVQVLMPETPPDPQKDAMPGARSGPGVSKRSGTDSGKWSEVGKGARLLDVGSGAGLPGVVIAICFPSLHVTCVDTVAKKAAFIKQVALTLKLPNLTGVHARVEALTAPAYSPFDVICARAFASLADFTQWSAGALAPFGVWMAMKGKHPQDELAALPRDIDVFHVEQLKVPSLDAERCIVWMRKCTAQAM
jgi:16S rRNA (guanine527-N7)-methyltransferase